MINPIVPPVNWVSIKRLKGALVKNNKKAENDKIYCASKASFFHKAPHQRRELRFNPQIFNHQNNSQFFPNSFLSFPQPQLNERMSFRLHQEGQKDDEEKGQEERDVPLIRQVKQTPFQALAKEIQHCNLVGAFNKASAITDQALKNHFLDILPTELLLEAAFTKLILGDGQAHDLYAQALQNEGANLDFQQLTNAVLAMYNLDEEEINYAEANSICTTAMEKNPDIESYSTEILHAFLLIKLKNNNTDEAIILLNKYLELNLDTRILNIIIKEIDCHIRTNEENGDLKKIYLNYKEKLKLVNLCERAKKHLEKAELIEANQLLSSVLIQSAEKNYLASILCLIVLIKLDCNASFQMLGEKLPSLVVELSSKKFEVRNEEEKSEILMHLNQLLQLNLNKNLIEFIEHILLHHFNEKKRIEKLSQPTNRYRDQLQHLLAQ